MHLNVLGSSSRGNCYLLQTLTGTLIIECGIKYMDIIQELNFNLQEVVGVLVSHQHL
jgi:Cft2 family RNA processing exonuclease